MTHQAIPRSGVQYPLEFGHYRAVIAGVGATLRELSFQGRDLVVPFDADEVRPAYRGAVLAPWPNRVIDGRYRFEGQEQQLALNEPARGHALHGLALWLDFAPIEPWGQDAAASVSSIELHAVIEPQQGYPHRIGITVRYALDASGLRTQVRAENLGSGPAPYGTGPHPYLAVAASGLDAATVNIPAELVQLVAGERLLPEGEVPVSQVPELDFRTRRQIGTVQIDHAYGSLLRDAEGFAELRLVNPDGTGVLMRWDECCPWVQVHTADRPGQSTHRSGLAVEPMSCPPNAFATGTDLVVLEPGARHEASWTIGAI